MTHLICSYALQLQVRACSLTANWDFCNTAYAGQTINKVTESRDDRTQIAQVNESPILLEC